MLLARVLTGLALAAIVASAILYLPFIWFALIFAVFAAVGIYEWAGFMMADQPLMRAVYVVAFLAGAGLLFTIGPLQIGVLYAAGAVWIGAIVSVLVYPLGSSVLTQKWFVAALGFVVLGGAWVALLTIAQFTDGRLWLIWLVFLTALTDIGGYFAGGAWGKHKLAPRVSPGKTWEGAFGGALAAGCICGVSVWIWQGGSLLLLALMVGLIILSIFGDLFESVMKRATGVKDSGAILPGHGGILDRMDSALAVLPVFAIVLQS